MRTSVRRSLPPRDVRKRKRAKQQEEDDDEQEEEARHRKEGLEPENGTE